jgi:hypothetical protein
MIRGKTNFLPAACKCGCCVGMSSSSKHGVMCEKQSPAQRHRSSVVKTTTACVVHACKHVGHLKALRHSQLLPALRRQGRVSPFSYSGNETYAFNGMYSWYICARSATPSTGLQANGEMDETAQHVVDFLALPPLCLASPPPSLSWI